MTKNETEKAGVKIKSKVRAGAPPPPDPPTNPGRIASNHNATRLKG